MPLELDAFERGELVYILETHLTDLRMEIAGTDRKDYRDHLKRREAFVKDVLARLGKPSWKAAGASSPEG